MIDDPAGRVDYDETGSGPAIVLVPGSCSTGAAWRPIMATWNGRFRCITTSLLGYGGTAERRSPQDSSIDHEAEIVEAVIARAGGGVHLVGHSFGALISLAVALRNRVSLKSLVIVEAPAAEILRQRGEHAHYRGFRQMTDAYFAAFKSGQADAIGMMIDFYGGAGTFASWPPKLRAYAMETTAVNLIDWASGYGFAPPAEALGAIQIPVLVITGSASNPVARRANALLAESIEGANFVVIEDASHFMIATHAAEVGGLIAEHVERAEVVT
jgi:pimeloyl-ACP methyl ester carboxylesterase